MNSTSNDRDKSCIDSTGKFEEFSIWNPYRIHVEFSLNSIWIPRGMAETKATLISHGNFKNFPHGIHVDFTTGLFLLAIQLIIFLSASIIIIIIIIRLFSYQLQY